MSNRMMDAKRTKYQMAAVVVSLIVLMYILSCGSSGNSAPEAGQKIHVSTQVELFLDDVVVANMENLTRELKQPSKHPSNPLIVQDQPWEDRLVEVYGTIIFDQEDNIFKAWYRASSDTIPSPEYFICYVESTDGIAWTKPFVGSQDFGPYPAFTHNMVINGGHGISILKMPQESDPNRVYKAGGGSITALSPDGINWAISPWPEVGTNDTGTSIVRWNEQYYAYVRDQGIWYNGVMRQIGVTTSPDFIHWATKNTLFVTDDSDGYPWTQPYSLSVTAYGDILIGVLSLLHLDVINGNNKIGDMDTQLIVSRDGTNWNRVCNRAVFLEPTAGSWDQGRVIPSTTMVVVGDQIRIYYTGSETRHGYGYIAPVSIGLATLPKDRFVSMRPTVPGLDGILETVPLRFNGTRLIVNAEIGINDLEVELLDQTGSLISGFEASNSVVVPIDALRYEVGWMAGGQAVPLSEAQQPVMLRFILRDGELFAFTFSD